MIKFDKKVDTIDSFNKWVVLDLRNLDHFNKHIELGLTHMVKQHDTNLTNEYELPQSLWCCLDS